MLSLEKENNNSNVICKILNDKKKEVNIVYLNDKIDKNKEGFTSLELKNNLKFQLSPDTTRKRNILYIAGCSGSGKSYFIKW